MKGFFFQSFFSFVAVYLLIGVTGMMLLLTVFYSIPEFDVSSFFLLSCSSAKLNGIGNVNDLNDQTNGKIIQGKILQGKVKKNLRKLQSRLQLT